MTSGTSESYAWLFRLLSDSGDPEKNRFLAPEPSYPLFDHIASHARVRLDPYPTPVMRNEKWDLSQVECQIRPETKGLLLVSPHNPTGKVQTQDELNTLEKLASQKKVALIHDEVFSEWVWNESLSGKKFPRLGRMTNTDSFAPLHFTLNGVSKMLGLPWLKLSWIYAGGSESGRLGKITDELELTADTFLSANGLAQKSLPHLLENRHLFADPIRKALKENLDFCLEEIRKIKLLSVEEPEGGVTLCLEVEEGFEEESLVLDLIEKGLYLFPGYFFDFPEDGRTRLILSIQHTREALEKGVAILRDFFISETG